jgi:hypothetical protein
VIEVSLLEIQGMDDGVGSRRHLCGMATEVWETVMHDGCAVWVILMNFQCNGVTQGAMILAEDK